MRFLDLIFLFLIFLLVYQSPDSELVSRVTGLERENSMYYNHIVVLDSRIKILEKLQTTAVWE